MWCLEGAVPVVGLVHPSHITANRYAQQKAGARSAGAH